MKFKTYLIVAILLATVNLCIAQQIDFLSEIKIYKINDKKLGEIQIGVLKGNSFDKKKPLLLILQGSGSQPTFIYVKSNNFVANSVSKVFQQYKDQYHIAYINKAGIPLIDSVATSRTAYKPNAFAIANSTRDWRVESASKAINFLVKELPVVSNKVYLVGHSEGAGIVPKIAAINNKVTKVVMMNCNALDHMYDWILNARQSAAANKISTEKAQETIDSLYKIQKDIFINPQSLDKTWDGWTYKRWASYLKETPLENMLSLSIPILFIASGKDQNTSVTNADYAPLEFERKGKTNLTYKVYSNHDHSHNMEITNADGKKETVNKNVEVIPEVFEWLAK